MQYRKTRISHSELHVGICKLFYDGVQALTTRRSKAAVFEAAGSRLVRLLELVQARAYGDGLCFWDLIRIRGGRPASRKHVPALYLFRPMIILLMHVRRTASEKCMFVRASRYAPHIGEKHEVLCFWSRTCSVVLGQPQPHGCVNDRSQRKLKIFCRKDHEPCTGQPHFLILIENDEPRHWHWQS